MNYLKFFELQQEPFQNDGDVQFYFESARHRRAEMLLMRAAHQHKALSLLVGGAGCGKTTVAHKLLMSLDADTFSKRMLVISHTDCGTGWLLPQMARAFGVRDVAANAPAQLEQIQAALLAHKRAEKHPVLIIDEAQMLSNEATMLEFRGALNLSPPGQQLLSIVLVGLPELAATVRLDQPLSQRVEVRSELAALDADEVKEYIEHRLAHAGATRPLFTPEAYSALHGFGHGIPRLLNTLADTSLFEAFMNGVKSVDGSLVAAARDQLALDAEAPLEPDAQGQTAVGAASQVAAVAAATPGDDSLEDFSMGAFLRKPGDTSKEQAAPKSVALLEETRLDEDPDADESAEFGVDLDGGSAVGDGAAALEIDLDGFAGSGPETELQLDVAPPAMEPEEKLDEAAQEAALAELDELPAEESIELAGLEIEEEPELELEAIEPESEPGAPSPVEEDEPDFRVKSMEETMEQDEEDSGTFDPSELLADSDPGDDPANAVASELGEEPELDLGAELELDESKSLDEMLGGLDESSDPPDADADAPPAPAIETAAEKLIEEDSEDLDDLFESIQVS